MFILKLKVRTKEEKPFCKTPKKVHVYKGLFVAIGTEIQKRPGASYFKDVK